MRAECIRLIYRRGIKSRTSRSGSRGRMQVLEQKGSEKRSADVSGRRAMQSCAAEPVSRPMCLQTVKVVASAWVSRTVLEAGRSERW